MSWRQTLGIVETQSIPDTHNSQNTHKSLNQGNCADIAYCADSSSKENTPSIMEILSEVCVGLTISPLDLKTALDNELTRITDGDISFDEVREFAKLLIQRNQMDSGIRPPQYNNAAHCKGCGPVWLWYSGEVEGCPWCLNRATDNPIPRPHEVRCGDCLNFERIPHPHLGHCTKGKQEAIAGLWDEDERMCDRFLQMP